MIERTTKKFLGEEEFYKNSKKWDPTILLMIRGILEREREMMMNNEFEF